MAGKADSLAEDLSRELSDLFKYVERYVPVEYSLESRFQPFIPEYVPSLGQVDDQIKVLVGDSLWHRLWGFQQSL